MSNIKVSVKWDCPTVFAGEEMRCTITFRNVSDAKHSSRSPSPNLPGRGASTPRERWKSSASKYAGNKPTQLGRGRPLAQAQRSTLSKSNLLQPARRQSPVIPEQASASSSHSHGGHKRSVSIVSLGNTGKNMSEDRQRKSSAGSRPPLGRGHERSSSYHEASQIIMSPPSSIKSPPDSQHPFLERNMTRSSSSPHVTARLASHTERREEKSPVAGGVSPHTGMQSGRRLSPRARVTSKASPDTVRNVQRDPAVANAANGHAIGPRLSPRLKEDDALQLKGLGISQALPKVLSPTRMSGTPRSSIDIDTNSNHSGETLASEYVVPGHSRQPSVAGHQRQPSQLAPVIPSNRPPETLMMGYVQIMGSFTLDGSLVDLTPFETVKRKGVIGGQGSGGVVGLEPPKRSSGLLGGLGWSNIGESLGGLLGGSELSSIREMKGIANAKSIPILSTSQAILFVNLKLAPGESKSYAYSYALPKGMPPTHRGRAMKVAYQLVIGTQRAQAAANQHLLRHVNIPFRVLPTIDVDGETVGHDLLSPHIVLLNIARTKSIGKGMDVSMQKLQIHDDEGQEKRRKNDDFLRFVKNILDKPRQGSSLSLLTPTDPLTPASATFDNGPDLTTKDVIDLVIQRSNATNPAKRSANRFQIQRAGDRVATISLSRSAFRLGETVSMSVDFRAADVVCLGLHVALETSELVDPALALRSAASIYRATRRVHAARAEQTVSAERAYFACAIPAAATPDFVTSGVRLEWKLRVEFVTSVRAEGRPPQHRPTLMEEVAQDERGRVLAAVQHLPCESFDVSVPIRVYGAAGNNGEQREINDLSI